MILLLIYRNICTQMPTDIQLQIERVIKSTLDDFWQTHDSPSPDSNINRSHEAPRFEGRNLEHLDRVLSDLENRASSIVREGPRFNAVNHGPVAMDDQDRQKRTQLDSHLDQVSAMLGRLEKLHIRFEARALLQSPPGISVLGPSAEDGSLSVVNLEQSELFLQSVDRFLNSTFHLVRTVM